MDTISNTYHDSEVFDGSRGTLSHATRVSTASTKSTDSDSDIHPLLRDYYDHAGDVMIVEGELHDLELERLERLTQRQLLRDQEKLLPNSDEDFDRQYHDRRTELLDRLASAQDRAAKSLKLCEHHELDVDKNKWSSESLRSPPYSPERSTKTRSIADRASLLGHGSADIPHFSSPATRDLATRFERLRSSIACDPQSKRADLVLGAKGYEAGAVTCVDRAATSAVADSSTANHQQQHNSRKESFGSQNDKHTTNLLAHRIDQASQSMPSLLLSSQRDGSTYKAPAPEPNQVWPTTIRRGDSLPDSMRRLSATSIGEGLSRPLGSSGRRVSGMDSSGIGYDWSYGPPENITDPELRSAYGVRARRLLAGTPGAVETLDSTFHVPSQPEKFFRQGRVFSTLWAQPGMASDGMVTDITNVEQLGAGVFVQVRRFVVIRARTSYCSAIPITTNRGKGASTPGLRKAEWAVIYTSKTAPDILPEERPNRGEPAMLTSIRVDPDIREYRLDPMSRLDFGKVFTIDFTVKVKSIGMVNRASVKDLLYQFRNVWKSSIKPIDTKDLPSDNGEDISNEGMPSKLRSAYRPPSQALLQASVARTISRPTKARTRPNNPLSMQASNVVGQLLQRGHSLDQISTALSEKPLDGFLVVVAALETMERRLSDPDLVERGTAEGVKASM